MQCFNNFIQSMLHNFKFASQYSLQNTPCSIEVFTQRVRDTPSTRMQRERRQPVFENVQEPHQMNIPPPQTGRKRQFDIFKFKTPAIQCAKVTVHKTACFWKWLSSTNQDGGFEEIRVSWIIRIEPLIHQKRVKSKDCRVLVNLLFHAGMYRSQQVFQ